MIPENRKPWISVGIVLSLSVIFFFVFLIMAGILFFKKGTSGVHPLSQARFLHHQEVVGIVEIEGVILDSKKTLKRLERFEEEASVKAVVLRLNSPGGAVAPSQEIYQAVQNYKKPLVISMGSVAASGAYYISCGAKKIFANPGTITGSIGVIMEFVNLEKLYDWAKIHRYAIKTGSFKGSGSEYRSMTSEERQVFQIMVNDVLSQFKEAVAVGRQLSQEKVDALADGRIFSGRQALEAHLIDHLGTLKDAVLEAARLGQIKGKPKTVTLKKQKYAWMDFFDGEEEAIEGLLPQRSAGSQVLLLLQMILKGFSLPEQRAEVPGMYWLWNGP